ncbi:MAG: DUF4870 domain-containing protein [Pseudoxanthomonas sp.]
MSDFESLTAPQEDRAIALLTHLSGILACFIVPLIIWLVNKDKPEKAWLTDQSKEALNFQITIAIGYIAGVILSMILIGVLVIFAVMIANLVFCILGGVKANEGVTYRYPFALRLIK